MSTEKTFDPTLPRVSSDVPDNIDSPPMGSPSSAARKLFADALDLPLPPGEGEAPSPPSADAAQTAEELVEGVREKLSLADARVRDFVERRPIVALCGAVAAGFLIGRIVSRI